MSSEFEWIDRFLSPLSGDTKGTFGLRNDGAVLRHKSEEEIVVTSDTLIEGVHFLPDEPPGMIARKALRVNISDLASMGAKPMAYTLNLALSRCQDIDFIEEFSLGLQTDQNAFGIYLAGGDTTKCDADSFPMTISMTLFGTCQKDAAWTRSGAQDGDVCLVTGSIGEAYLGLKFRLGEIVCPDENLKQRLLARHNCPEPRTGLCFLENMDCVNAAIDLSDGLLADIGHICHHSGVEIVINETALPIREDVRKLCQEAGIAIESLATGGDDYELALAVPEKDVQSLQQYCQDAGLELTEIGRFKKSSRPPESRVCLLDENNVDITPQKRGWSHF